MTNPVSRPIVAGMDVCDVGGDKVGSVAVVHRFDPLPDPAASGAPEEILEVKTGLLGLGKHLYVPMSAVQEVLTEHFGVDFDDLDWEPRYNIAPTQPVIVIRRAAD